MLIGAQLAQQVGVQPLVDAVPQLLLVELRSAQRVQPTAGS